MIQQKITQLLNYIKNNNDFPDEIFIGFKRIGSHIKFFQWASTISYFVINFANPWTPLTIDISAIPSLA